jgi:tetratricopeptide (TPR) repeat protein
VVVFWYSPRYRFPALPLLAVLGAQGLAALLERRARDTRGALFALVLCASVATGPLNRWLGFDEIDGFRPAHEHALANALASEGRLEEALEHERRAALLGHADAAVAAGDILRRLGRMPEALLALEEAAERQPASAFARKSLAIALAQAGELARARAEFEAALALAPGDAEALSGLGNVLAQQGEPRLALEKQRAALARNPRLVSARLALAWLLATAPEAALRDPAQALALCEGLERERAHGEAGLLDLRAAALAAAGRFPEAVVCAARAAALAPDDALVRERLAAYRSGHPWVQERE